MQYLPPSYLYHLEAQYITRIADFPDSPVIKNLPAKARDTNSTTGPRRSHLPRSS